MLKELQGKGNATGILISRDSGVPELIRELLNLAVNATFSMRGKLGLRKGAGYLLAPRARMCTIGSGPSSPRVLVA